MKKWLLTIATILVLPTAALAQSADAATQASSFWMSLFMTLLPIFLLAFLFGCFLFEAFAGCKTRKCRSTGNIGKRLSNCWNEWRKRLKSEMAVVELASFPLVPA